MARYAVLIHPAGKEFGVTVPDCPGCTTQADTLDGALELAAEALRLWAEAEASAGRKVPSARPLEAVLGDADVKYEVKRGAIPAAVPLLLDAGRSIRLNISLDAGLVEAIDEAARSRGLTRSAFLASAARDKIAS